VEKIILTTQNELENLIQNSVRQALSEQNEKPIENKDAILSIDEAGNFLRLAKQTLYGFTSKNEIPFFKKGKKLYFRKAELEQWLLDGKQKTLQEIQAEVIKDIHKKGK
jgi:excisionase family DNA binding protein